MPHKPALRNAELNTVGVDTAVRVTGEPRSIIVAAIHAYLNGVSASKFAKNPRIVRLATMEVGKCIFWQHGGKRGTLQTLDRARARILMANPEADWAIRQSAQGLMVKRIA